MRDNDEIENDEIRIASLVERYEEMRQNGHFSYFDVEDFEAIVSHYLYNAKVENARKAIDDGMHCHPYSLELKLKLIEVEIEDGNWQCSSDLISEAKAFAVNGNVELCLLEVRALLLQSKVREAVALLDGLLENHYTPEDIDLHQVVGDLINISEYEHAISYLKFACKYQNSNESLLLDLAFCYERIDSTDKAIATYERYLDENPFSTFAWFELAKLYEQNRVYEDAVQAYDFVLTLDPVFADGYYAKADMQIAEGFYDDAIKTLSSLLEEASNETRASYMVGECYEKLGQLENALSTYLSVLEYDDKYTDAYYAAAFVLKDLGEIDRCIAFLKKATILDPDNCEYHYGFGKVMMEYGNRSDAIKAFENALEIDRYDFESWLLLAELYSTADFGKALSVLEEASVFLYDIPEISFRIAALYFLTSNIDKCLEYFERGVLLDVDKVGNFFDICPAARFDERIMTIYINSKIKNSI